MMNFVFMNSLEKVTKEHVWQGQISICEHHGKWQVFWSVTEPGGEVIQETWYEGNAWEEMMQVFRIRISEKLGEGFLPLLEGVTDEFSIPEGREEVQQMILCYSELNRNEELYEELREWRKSIAIQDNKAAYIIATNRILGLISTYIPHTKDELKQIPGFGAYRMQHYGDAILKITSKYERDTTFPLDWVAGSLDRQQFKLWYYRQKYVKMAEKNDQQERKKAMLKMIDQGATLEQISERFELHKRDAILMIEQLEAEGYKVDRFIDTEMAAIPEDLRDAVLSVFAELGDEYLKPVLQAVYGDEAPSGPELNQVYTWLRILRLHHKRTHNEALKV